MKIKIEYCEYSKKKLKTTQKNTSVSFKILVHIKRKK